MSFFASLIKMLPDAAAQGLIWGILAIGVFITYKLLDFSDLTVDGSICTGGAVAALLIISAVATKYFFMVLFCFKSSFIKFVVKRFHWNRRVMWQCCYKKSEEILAKNKRKRVKINANLFLGTDYTDCTDK